MIGYGLLRYLGCPPAEAAERLAAMRPVTRAQVGAERLAWADREFGAT